LRGCIKDHAFKHRVLLMAYPPNLTHLLQGEDVVVFRSKSSTWDNCVQFFNATHVRPFSLRNLGNGLQWLYHGAPQWDIAPMFTRKAATAMFKQTGLVPFNPHAIDRSTLRPTLQFDDIRNEVPPAEEQAAVDLTRKSGMERENAELKMKLADAERKRKDAEERLDDMAAEIRLPGGKKIKFAWGGLANHPEAMARASLEKAKMAVLAADPNIAPKVPPKKRDCSGIPIAECSRWTVEYLVTECKRRGLRHAGKKPELVARLLVDLDLEAAKAQMLPFNGQSIGVYF
jgi:hypothetical protein